MKKQIIAVISLFILSAGASAETGAAAAGSFFAGAGAAPFSLGAFQADIPVPGYTLVREEKDAAPAARLSQAEKDGILLALDPAAWTVVSAQPYADWWMPLKVWAGQGDLNVSVNLSVMGGTNGIPLRRVGGGYEYGPWYYCHGSISQVEERCIFRVRVRFDVVSSSLLQGTIYSQWELDGTQAEHSFTYKKK